MGHVVFRTLLKYVTGGCSRGKLERLAKQKNCWIQTQYPTVFHITTQADSFLLAVAKRYQMTRAMAINDTTGPNIVPLGNATPAVTARAIATPISASPAI